MREWKQMTLWFVIVQLILLLIASWTWNYGGDKILLDRLSLVSSVSAILLAFVAIVYTFIQSNSTSQQNAVIQLNLQKINDNIRRFNHIQDQFDEFKGMLKEFRNEFKDITLKMSGGYEDVIRGLNEVMELNARMGNKDNAELINQVQEKVKEIIKKTEESKTSIESLYRESYIDIDTVLKSQIYKTIAELPDDTAKKLCKMMGLSPYQAGTVIEKAGEYRRINDTI